jgi:CheY-like chemotaxis protein
MTCSSCRKCSARRGSRAISTSPWTVRRRWTSCTGKADFADAPVPDVVLLDLNLPKKDGRQVLAEIKSDPNLRRIPVIVLTTSAAEQDVMHAYDKHANAFVRKPVGYTALLLVVRSIEHFWMDSVLLPPREPAVAPAGAAVP